LKTSPFYSVLADECEDISTKEELTICFRWINNGRPEEHFVNILRIKALDAATITDALCSFIKTLIFIEWLARAMMVQQLS
jgi:hypothetical protein